MKKSVRGLIFTGAAVFVLGLFGCAPQANTNTAPTTTMATPAATPDKAAIEAELTRIENDWPRVMKERDAAAVRRVEADDIILVYPDGTLGSKDQDIKDIESGSLTADSWEVSDLKVNVLGPDLAVVSLRSTVTKGRYKTAEGKIQDISGQYRSVDTFMRRNDQWQLVGSATTPARPQAPSAAASPAAKASPVGSPATKPSPAMPAMKESPAMKPSPAAKPSPARKAATPATTP